MFKYEKPIVLEYEDVAEGIYAASGNEETGGETGGEGGGESGGGEGGEEETKVVDYENDGDCWKWDWHEIQRVQNAGDSFVIYKIHATHPTGLKHISSKQRVDLLLSSPNYSRIDAQEYPVTPNGCQAEFVREKLADAYNSGDEFTCDVRISCSAEEAATMSLVNVHIYCTHSENVQGGMD